MASPPVTVLMPVYNGESFLREAVESVLNQSFADFEFLIIDDGSTDRTAEILQEFNDHRIKVVRNRENVGLIATLNLGLDLAQGGLIARMDCDDLCAPHRLRRQFCFLDKLPEVGLVGTWAEVIGDGGGGFYKPYRNHERLKAELLFNSALVHSSVMMRKSVLKEHGLQYEPELTHVEDFDLWVKMSRACRLANIPSVLLRYRVHGKSASFIHQHAQRNNARRIFARELRLLGIDATKEELELHQSLGLYEFDPATASVNVAMAWLARIYKANRAMKQFNGPALAQVLGSRWYGVCKKLSGSRFARTRLFFRAPFAKKAIVYAALGKMWL